MKIFSPLDCKSTRETRKPCKLLRRSGCLNSDRTTPGNASNKRGQPGRTSSQVRDLLRLGSADPDDHADDQRLPPIPTRLSLVKMFIELELFEPALLVLTGIMATDDQEVEAWYLEGWCFFIMAEKAQEAGGKLSDLTWDQLARDGRDCLETCKMVRSLYFLMKSRSLLSLSCTRPKNTLTSPYTSTSSNSSRSWNHKAYNPHQTMKKMRTRADGMVSRVTTRTGTSR